MAEPASFSGARADYDFTATDLGDPQHWPLALRLSVDIVLAAPLPMLLDWGDAHVTVFNAAYAALAGSRFVRAPGARVPSILPAPMAAAADAFARARAGQTLILRRQQLEFIRDDGAHRCELDLHLLPLRDEHERVLGVLCTLHQGNAAAALPAASGSLRILVVEDNLDSQYLVCEMLKAFGHQPDGCGHAEAALQLLDGTRYDVLFSDVSLPGMSGVEMARLAMQRQPQLQVIFASGYGDTLLRHVEFPYQSLQKPYELDQLQNALARIVQGGADRV